MRDNSCWHSALVASLVIHLVLLFLLSEVGLLSFPVAAAEQYIELSLIDEPPAEEMVTGTATGSIIDTASRPKITPDIKKMSASQANKDITNTEKPAEHTGLVAGMKDTGMKDPLGNCSEVGLPSVSVDKTKKTATKLSSPYVIQKVDPEYPDEMRRQGKSGTVAVKIEILENGLPGSIMLQRSSGWAELDKAALKAIRLWKFAPARDAVKNQAIRCYTVLAIKFDLN